MENKSGKMFGSILIAMILSFVILALNAALTAAGGIWIGFAAALVVINLVFWVVIFVLTIIQFIRHLRQKEDRFRPLYFMNILFSLFFGAVFFAIYSLLFLSLFTVLGILFGIAN